MLLRKREGVEEGVGGEKGKVGCSCRGSHALACRQCTDVRV
jgi:hypothetical protein